MNDDPENPWADSAETARTFDAASGDFDELTPTVWGPAGQALVFQLGVAPDEAVLDACCGTGSSALPAAAAVGPEGLVHGVDVADEMLEHGRLTAERRGLKNIEFVCADASQWEAPSDVPDAGYDVLSISYGVFFLPDMDRTFWRLVSLVRQGGRAGVTVWRRGAMEEFSSIVFDVASRYSPDCASTAPCATAHPCTGSTLRTHSRRGSRTPEPIPWRSAPCRISFRRRTSCAGRS